MSITLGDGWVIDSSENRVPVYSGEFHYFRNERKHWPRILKGMKEAGFTFVTSFVQPNWHEYEPGKFDFQGKTSPERDLPYLMELVKENGLWVELRLGPSCCEWRESGGTSFGTPWKDISDAFWDVVGPYSADNGGPLLLYQIHNEWFHPLLTYYIMKPAIDSFDGFRAQSVPHWLELCGPNAHFLAAGYQFSMDYLPSYLASLYPGIESMNNAWGTAYGSFDEVRDELLAQGVDTLHKYIEHWNRVFKNARFPGESPRRMIDILNWPLYFTVAQLAEDVDYTRAFTNLPIMHNWSMGDERRWSRMAHLDLAGYDMYAPMSTDIWNWNKNTYDMQSSPFPFSNEFMCGTIERYEWGGQGYFTDHFARMEILSYLMGGMKGFNLYMFVERDNWLQCPLDERGGKRSSFFAISEIVKALRRNNWHETATIRDLGVFKNPDYFRHADGSDDGIFDVGYPEDYIRDGLYQGHSPRQQFVSTFRALHDAHIDFSVFKDTRGGETIRDFKTILAYSLWFMDREMAGDLLKWVEDGGNLVLWPCVPTHDETGSEMDLFTSALGLKPFDVTQNDTQQVDIEQVSIASILTTDNGNFTTADGKLWGQVRKHGAGRVLALNVRLAQSAESLERVAVAWGGCRKYADTGLPLTDGGMALHPDGFALLPVVNGMHEGSVSEVVVDISPLPESDIYSVTDELSQAILGAFTPADGKITVPVEIGPRDGVLLKVSPGQVAESADTENNAEVIALSDWFTRHEDESEYHRRYLGPELDQSWAEVPAKEWTLPALASGKVLGVQGWFYFKQNVQLPLTDGPVYLNLQPMGFHNMGIVYVNGTECGRFAIERPGAASVFDVTAAVNKGADNALAIRLYRQSLDCHDRGASGFDLLRFECGSQVVNVDTLYIKQERRDYGEEAGWMTGDISGSDWPPISTPVDISMDRTGDALWLRKDIEVADFTSAELLLEGMNCVVSVFVNGEYVVKSPMLPCRLELGEFLKAGTNRLALRLTPDNFENYLVPRADRYRTYIRDGFLPLRVRFEKAEIAVSK